MDEQNNEIHEFPDRFIKYLQFKKLRLKIEKKFPYLIALKK